MLGGAGAGIVHVQGCRGVHAVVTPGDDGEGDCGTERNWSVYGQIWGTGKAHMSHLIADKLVYCHEAKHLQLRMQSAGWEADER